MCLTPFSRVVLDDTGDVIELGCHVPSGIREGYVHCPAAGSHVDETAVTEGFQLAGHIGSVGDGIIDLGEGCGRSVTEEQEDPHGELRFEELD